MPSVPEAVLGPRHADPTALGAVPELSPLVVFVSLVSS